MYFEEITFCSENITSMHGNLDPVSLKESNSFFNIFDEAELHVVRSELFFASMLVHLNLKIPGNQFTKEMQKEVEFLVARYRLGATTPSSSVIRNDMSQFYEQLLLKQKEDSHWFVKVTWEEETNTLMNLFWMSPKQILLWFEFSEAIGHNNTMATRQLKYTKGTSNIQKATSQNACIKRMLENSNTSICDLGKALVERSKEVQKQKQFEE
ncbi:22173_t:CDS:2 [Gigaspora rosea]|nr:22173_t:CDS:2 [Gigaspora rosea]